MKNKFFTGKFVLAPKFAGSCSMEDLYEQYTEKLGKAELEIMQVIWSSRCPVTSNYILKELQGKRTWKLFGGERANSQQGLSGV